MHGLRRVLSIGRRYAGAAVALMALVLAACDTPLSPNLFSWTVTPRETTLRPGATAVITITIHSKSNINAAVDLTVESLPAGLTPSFTSMRLPDTASTATLTIQAAPNVELGTYSASLKAKEVGGSQVEEELRLTVSNSEGADITLELTPAELYLPADGASTFTYYARPLNGFSGPVSVTLSPVPFELILEAPPTPGSITIGGGRGGAGGTFVLRRRGPADRAFVDLTVTASSGALVRTRRLRIHFRS